MRFYQIIQLFSIDCKAVLENIKPQLVQKCIKPALEGLLHQPVEVESGLQTKTLLLKITTALLHTNSSELTSQSTILVIQNCGNSSTSNMHY